MLTHQKKAAILTRTGTAVPPFPARPTPAQDGGGREPDGQAHAIAAWNRNVDILFVNYAAARAAKSLREAQQALQLDRLRKANSRPGPSSR